MSDQFVFPASTYRMETSYRTIGEDARLGMMGCGFLLQNQPSSRGFLDTPPPWYGILYLMRGRGMYVDAAGAEIPLHAGSVIQRFPGCHHATFPEAGSGWAECFVVIGPQVGASLMQIGVLNPACPVFDIGYQPSLVQSFDAHMLRMRHALESELPQVLTESIQLIIQVQQLAQQECPHPHRDAVKNACHELCAATQVREVMERVATRHHLSYERLRKVFRTMMGVTPGQFRIREQMDRACRLLRETDLTVQQIAQTLDYPDAYSFSRQFKKQIGLAPKHFRQMR